jgi:ankyrin repeat protein
MLVEFTASMQDDADVDADEMEDAVMDIGGMGMKPSTLNYDDDDENDKNGVNAAAREHPLHEAAMSGNLEELKQLLKSSSNDEGQNNAAVDPNGQDSSGQTALHLCADRGNLDCLDLLIQSGAEIDIGDQDGITPLQTAVISGHAKICERLMEAGANPDKPDNDGDTPRASAEDDKGILALLEKYPAK